MKTFALTVWQPWASLIAIGAKPYEFRRWPAPARLVGQRIVIHAGARPAKRLEISELILDLLSKRDADGTAMNQAVALQLLDSVLPNPARLPHACGLGTAILGKPRLCVEMAEELKADSDRIDEHVWAWPVSDFQFFTPPIPARGAQGFWPWSHS